MAAVVLQLWLTVRLRRCALAVDPNLSRLRRKADLCHHRLPREMQRVRLPVHAHTHAMVRFMEIVMLQSKMRRDHESRVFKAKRNVVPVKMLLEAICKRLRHLHTSWQPVSLFVFR